MKVPGMRRQSVWRVNLYKAIILSDGIKLVKHVYGQYGRFKPSTIDNDIMPRLPGLIERTGFNYPFAVEEHKLKAEVLWELPEGVKARTKNDVYGPPREAKTAKRIVAIITAYGQYKLVGDNDTSVPG